VTVFYFCSIPIQIGRDIFVLVQQLVSDLFIQALAKFQGNSPQGTINLYFHLYLLQVKFKTKFSSKVFRLLASRITTYLSIARHKSYYSIRLRLEIQKSSQVMQARKFLILFLNLSNKNKIMPFSTPSSQSYSWPLSTQLRICQYH